jgi:hypothetical protein
MQNFCLLKQVVYIVTTVLKRAKYCEWGTCRRKRYRCVPRCFNTCLCEVSESAVCWAQFASLPWCEPEDCWAWSGNVNHSTTILSEVVNEGESVYTNQLIRSTFRIQGEQKWDVSFRKFIVNHWVKVIHTRTFIHWTKSPSEFFCHWDAFDECILVCCGFLTKGWWTLSSISLLTDGTLLCTHSTCSAEPFVPSRNGLLRRPIHSELLFILSHCTSFTELVSLNRRTHIRPSVQ